MSDTVTVGLGGGWVNIFGGPSPIGLGVLQGNWERGRLDLSLPQKAQGWLTLRGPVAIGFIGEISGIHIPEDSTSYIVGLTGMTWSPYPALVFDTSVAVGFGAESPDFVVLFGLTRNLGPKPKGARIRDN